MLKLLSALAFVAVSFSSAVAEEGRFFSEPSGKLENYRSHRLTDEQKAELDASFEVTSCEISDDTVFSCVISDMRDDGGLWVDGDAHGLSGFMSEFVCPFSGAEALSYTPCRKYGIEVMKELGKAGPAAADRYVTFWAEAKAFLQYPLTGKAEKARVLFLDQAIQLGDKVNGTHDFQRIKEIIQVAMAKTMG